MRPLAFALAAVVLAACAENQAPPAVPENASGAPASGPAAPKGDPFVLVGPVRTETLPILNPAFVTKGVLPPAPVGLAAAPATCAPFVARTHAGACKKGDTGELLAAALAEGDVDKRDQLLADIEGCPILASGIGRALRAELAPTACGEALVEPLLKQGTKGITPVSQQVLIGLAVSSRLARAGTNPPELKPPFEKARVLEFIKGPMGKWFNDQANLVEELSHEAFELTYYAQGIAAIECGMADLRLVEAVRAAPIPVEFQKDAELKNVYYGSLDQMLDPRKDRGRDAALVGLKQLSLVGALDDRRIGAARAMLSRLYGGRKLDALDALLLPPVAAHPDASVEEKLAARLPTFYASLLIEGSAATRPGTMERFAVHGVPMPTRAVLAKEPPSPEIRGLYARARLESARVYWRGLDVDQAAQLAADWPAATPRPDDVTLVFAVALALRAGPEDAAEMMRKAPLSRGAEADVAALDALANKPGYAFAGLAAFDAALIRQVLAPQGAPAAYFQDLARRYRDAAAKLGDPKQKANAAERASAAEQTAAAIH
jgi:hypothetical protein